MTDRILVTERTFDWHACIEGNVSKWEAGSKISSAVNALIRSFPNLKDSEIVLKLLPNFTRS